MSIPFNFSPLGMVGTGILPVGYMEAEFLESTGTQYVNTLFSPDDASGIKMEVQNNSPKSDSYQAGVLQNVDGVVMRFVPYRASGLNCIGGWGTNMPYNTSFPLEECGKYKWVAELNYLNSRKISISSEAAGYSRADTLTGSLKAMSKPFFIFARNDINGIAFNWVGKVFSTQATHQETIKRDYVPSLDNQGVPCLFDKVSRKPFYNSGSGQFIVGMDMNQACQLAKLPATGGELTVSLPWEAQLVQHNSEVEAALETARSKGWLLKVQYRDAEAESAVYNKYATCKNAADMAAVNADYMTDVTNDGEWNYPLPGLTDARNLFLNCKDSRLKKIKVEANAVTGWISYLAQGTYIEEADITTPLATTAAGVFFGSRVKKIRIVAPKCTQFVDFASGASYLTDIEGDISSARNMACGSAWLNKKSVLWLCGQMAEYTGTSHSAYGGTLYLGVHVDHKNDEEVLAAISSVEDKNYVVVLSWFGTPTASASATYGLRKPPIYAKLSERDGMSERVLEWGHYVTNWEENGYREFASVAEAEEYFGLEKEIQQ